MDERVPKMGLATPVGDAGGGRTVFTTLGAAHESPTTSGGDVAQLFDVHVQQRPGLIMLVAANLFAGTDVNVRQPIQSTPHQHSVHRGGRYRQARSDR